MREARNTSCRRKTGCTNSAAGAAAPSSWRGRQLSGWHSVRGVRRGGETWAPHQHRNVATPRRTRHSARTLSHRPPPSSPWTHGSDSSAALPLGNLRLRSSARWLKGRQVGGDPSHARRRDKTLRSGRAGSTGGDAARPSMLVGILAPRPYVRVHVRPGPFDDCSLLRRHRVLVLRLLTRSAHLFAPTRPGQLPSAIFPALGSTHDCDRRCGPPAPPGASTAMLAQLTETSTKATRGTRLGPQYFHQRSLLAAVQNGLAQDGPEPQVVAGGPARVR
jgi:hypothetical protein